ncbi:uncharacterized protein LOC114530377 [Dendronephthya gigantea]|uniref:uncharacterized protein LOC114530377 n=1 Tax=Dendronephthya gigantea TaxID=151771 RepID=UPI00106C364E|nr:uncharacterized protein LOC114530377 [Dendronephthya gigantea]
MMMSTEVILFLTMVVSLTNISCYELHHLQRKQLKENVDGAMGRMGSQRGDLWEISDAARPAFHNIDDSRLSRLRHYVPGFDERDENNPNELTFAQSLFEDPFSVKVRQAVLETKFFQRIINNTLAPEQYGGYMVQDAAYVFDAVKAFDSAAKNMQGKHPPDFALFYRGRSASFTSYASYFVSKWKLKSTKSIITGPAAATYVAYEMKLAQNKPKYLSIGILPCDMLWPWVAKQINDQVPKTHVYRSWVDDNLSDGSSSAQKFANKFFTAEDKEDSQPIFNEGIINELNFFRSACGEKPVSYEFGIQE